MNSTLIKSIVLAEAEFSAIRSGGPGGQNVNKISSAVQIRFAIPHSTLPQYLKERLLESGDKRINYKGEIIIKSQEFRTQEKNRDRAIAKLCAWIFEQTKTAKKRVSTQPTKSSKVKRKDQKQQRSQVKSMRSKVHL